MQRLCLRHKAQKPQNVSYGRYAAGQKRCQTCDIFLHWNNLWCPCCGVRLRIRPRQTKYKVYLEQKNALR